MIQSNQIVSPEIYTDRTLLAKLPESVAEEIRRRELTLNGKGEKVSFVGVLLLNDMPYVFLPRSTQANSDDSKLELASSTLKVVEKYGRESETRVDLQDDGEGRKNLNQLGLICALLDDFRQNGIYTRRREVRKINQGKTDWKRTVNKVLPFPDRVGYPIYLDTHGIKRQYFNNCEIAVIHASVIHQIDKRFSWIVTGNLQPVAPGLREYSPPIGNIDYQLSRLINELNQVYSDRDIRLLKFLIRYLEMNAGSEISNFTAGLEKFHFCWEYMLGKVLKDTVDLNNQLPAPAYIDKNGSVLTANEKGMRTDIILHDIKTNRYTVADAKYYSATGVLDAPGWSDIVKQLFYEKALQKLDEVSTIKNTFIFPGREGNLKRVVIRNRAKSNDENHVFVNEFKPIYCYYVEPIEVIRNYLKGSKMIRLTEQLLEQEKIF